MGEPGEPGSPSREIIRAGLASGLGMAMCSTTCPARNSGDPNAVHDLECPVEEAGRRMVEILRKESSP
ncbi:MAG: hypothetical protein A2122_01420 [Candidatus Liptonbacteria bacterium GWB1_49_6]|uniref:Uncharacterized protein n=1 Tax=Candidatus Liptonbacteria bacterium GWB1_49_6 TaxID=1798644 RepID=A0A1G2C8B8_9BACT|nr:MAG: hypothetical protein A2122_01420 [Candidatus Liptonbacteria bacterium GWB1_49_6]